MMRRFTRRLAWLVPALVLSGVDSARAQLSLTDGIAAAGGVDAAEAPQLEAERYVVVHLAENRIYLMDQGRPIWTAPAATGNGFRLETDDGRSWHFATPRGVFQVKRKEKDPLWYKPDWAYAKEGKTPPADPQERYQEGMLGTTAMYIGFELAIHGTDQPELVLNPDPEERRVSHGCIRLTNEDARTLFHLVEVGTPVLIY